ncbi:MAG: hypothetical protein PWR19_975 [Carnobacterium sp.]|uniref:Uncharacterized protein n=1 Tax=Carnobacterium inhibens subsp. gilichinskyi TaxID=1266845 RepID=U5SCJ3_9LACT|nr:hypothetical protein Q783_00380 [Carnobacterium inhibens subsp. gilichinskyi]MDN5371929.1 hypothetical protein [Carnobacterium sp.]
MRENLTLKKIIMLFIISFAVLFIEIYFFTNSNGLSGAIIRTIAMQSLVFVPIFILKIVKKYNNY